MNNVSVKFNVSGLNDNLKKAQRWLDEEVFLNTEEYLPFRQGIMHKVSKISNVYGSGLVIYGNASVPYARYLYCGKVMVGKAPKKVTDKPLTYDKTAHSHAGSHWFERSKAVNKNHWIQGVKKIIGGKR